MYNLYSIPLTSNTLSLTGISPAKVTFDPSAYIVSDSFGTSHNLIYKISYNFASEVNRDIIYTVYPSSYNLENIIPIGTPVEYEYNSMGTHVCYISVYEIGVNVTTITATISLSANKLLDLYLLKSSMYNVKNDTLYVLESEDPNIVLPVYLNWEKEKTQYIDPIYYPTPTVTPSITITSTCTPTPTLTPTNTPTNTPTVTPTITNTLTITPTTTPSSTVTPTPTPTLTITPSITPTNTPTATVTPSPTTPIDVDIGFTYRFSRKGVYRYKIPVPAGSSFIFTYDAGQVPDRFNILTHDNTVIHATGWVGLDSYNSALHLLGESSVEGPPVGIIALTNNSLEDYIYVEVKVIFSSSKGQFTVNIS
jgi:hypothetical protein